MAIQVTRTYVGYIQNHQQVKSGLDSLGDSASKIWNVARWTADRIWDATGEIPDAGVLKSYMKNQQCWKDLNAQSSQKVIEELSDAFQSWFDLRQKDDKANPPGYRKHGDTRPKRTVTFKLCEYQTRPNVDLSDVNKVQNVRAVWNSDEWELHFVCKVELETTDSAGDNVAGIDLGITNIATIAFPDEYVLYPGNSRKQDTHYFKRAEYNTEGDNGPSEKAAWARRKLAERETHFYHTLTSAIIEECVERGVGTLAVSWPENVRESDWGKTGNKKLHSWAFDRIYQYLAYKGEVRGVEVPKENEWDTSKTCSKCGDNTKSNRKHRGLYVCQSCGLVGNADCNGAETMRQKTTPSPHGEDRSNGCVAQPSTYLFDRESGMFRTRERVVS